MLVQCLEVDIKHSSTAKALKPVITDNDAISNASSTPITANA